MVLYALIISKNRWIGTERLEFERAANIRDRIEEMRKHIGKSASAKMFDFGRKKQSRNRKIAKK